MQSLLLSHPALTAAGFEVQTEILPGLCHVDDARNILVAKFLQTNADALVFIDADMDWDERAIVRLASIDRDVVGVAYPKKTDNPQYAAGPLPGEIWSDAEGLIEVSHVGTGFLKIKRHVLQALFDASAKYKTGEADEACAEVFVRAIDSHGQRVSGDVNFCHRWRAMGGAVYVDPEVRIGHVGQKLWAGSYGSHLRIKSGLALSRGIERIRSGEYEPPEVIELVDEWGNDGFAASYELVAMSIAAAQKAQGPILEAGSGLTSLVMAATGAEVHSLESEPFWFERMQSEKARLGLDSLHVHYAPITDQPGGRWYSQADWPAPDIVLCDGPKRDRGNRDVLFRRLNGATPRILLVDDTDEIGGELRRWAEAHNMALSIKGEIRKFAVGVRND